MTPARHLSLLDRAIDRVDHALRTTFSEGIAAARPNPGQAVPQDKDTRTARSTPAASMTATVSAAYSSFVYAAAPAGRPDLPLPRPSNVTTRKCRAR